ncbi:MAG: hypothetical protein KGL42_16990 [Betaproteobacteria bacterium]|nr:hypothetical protein [Betaproteobacteria bacterium]
MKAAHHSQPANSARNQQRRKTLIDNAPFLALIPFGIVTFYPPANPYANEVYSAACLVFTGASVRLALHWLTTSKSVKNKNS